MDDVAAVPAAVPPTSRQSEPVARVPRMNSSTIDASTNAENVYAIRPGVELPSPRRSARTPVTSEATAGMTNVFPSARSDARRHATSGPIPISSSSGSPKLCRKKL